MIQTPKFVVLFGGDDGYSWLSDTWLWDGTTWSRAAAGPAPWPRSRTTMAYDELRERVVLFGGIVGGAGGSHDDVWEWDGASSTNQLPAMPFRRSCRQSLSC